MVNWRRDPKIVHETVIRDIVDVISGAKDAEVIQGIYNRDKSFKSISAASSNFVLVFPVVVSKTVSIENASMISKAIERKAVTMLQILFSAINISESKDALDYIKNFHTNIKFDSDITVDSLIDALDTYVVKNESVIRNRDLYEAAKQDLKNINNYLPDTISESSINDYKVYPQSFFGESVIIKEADDIITTQITKNTRGSNSRDKYQKNRDISATKKDNMELIQNQLLDSDVKKANELVPSMMIVNMINTAYDQPIDSQIVIGVKAKMYPVDSTDILNRLKVKNQDNNGLLKFIKATTREISFFRDFLFAIDKAKLDALSQSKRGSSSKLWKILERRALKSKIRRTLGHPNDASAITTLVISQEEVEYLNKSENIDLDKPQVISPMLESYNLMGFCIVDEALEVAKFIFDTGDDLYEALSFKNLERENSNGDYKKIINLMNKVSR